MHMLNTGYGPIIYKHAEIISCTPFFSHVHLCAPHTAARLMVHMRIKNIVKQSYHREISSKVANEYSIV